MMDDKQVLARRVKELEIKAAFADDALEQLNAVVTRQQRQIELLARQMGELRQQWTDAAAGAAALRNLREEVPPHY